MNYNIHSTKPAQNACQSKTSVKPTKKTSFNPPTETKNKDT